MIAIHCALALAAFLQAAPSGPPFPRIANCYGVGLTPDSTDKDIEEVARFDLLIGGLWANWSDASSVARLHEKVARVRERNPHIVILDFSSSAPYADPNDKSFPSSGWLLTPKGERVAGWPGTSMINLRKGEVIDWLVARSVASIRERGFDGTFIDCMSGGFDWWACNIESGKPYEIDSDENGVADARDDLDRAWVAAKTELSRRVREEIGPERLFMTNQGGEWGYAAFNGILFEDNLDYVLAGGADWEGTLRPYLHWTETPHRPTLTTIVSSSGLEPPYDPWKSMKPEERDALLERGRALLPRMRFGLATALMGDGYFAYDLHTRWRGQRWWYPEYDAPLGYPTGPAVRQPDGTWRREFDGGAVIVNPTCFDAVATFPEVHRDVSGGKVAKRFVIPAQDGRILLPSGDAEAAGTLADPDPVFSADGPDGVVERGDRLLLRSGGVAALLGADGRVMRVVDRAGRTLIEGLCAFVVSDDRWRDFAYSGVTHEPTGTGGVRFNGRRTEGDASAAFVAEIAPTESGLTVRYEWEALTAAHFHMFRQQADFPVAEYGGGSYLSEGAQGLLAVERAPEPQIAGGLRDVTVTSRGGERLGVRVSADAGLVDERHYGVPAFRLGAYPAPADPRPGDRWTYTITVERME
jgi:hypothetical protein